MGIMHKATTNVLLGSALAVAVAGCATQPQTVNYTDQGLYSGNTAGNQPYVEISSVTVRRQGYIWDSCAQMTDDVLDELRDTAAAAGANRVINLGWKSPSEVGFSSQPQCVAGLGWFALFGVGGLGPWVKTVEARGTLVYVTDGTLDALKDEAAAHARDYEQRRREALEEARRARMEAAEQQAEAIPVDEQGVSPEE